MILSVVNPRKTSKKKSRTRCSKLYSPIQTTHAVTFLLILPVEKVKLRFARPWHLWMLLAECYRRQRDSSQWRARSEIASQSREMKILRRFLVFQFERPSGERPLKEAHMLFHPDTSQIYQFTKLCKAHSGDLRDKEEPLSVCADMFTQLNGKMWKITCNKTTVYTNFLD